MLFVLAVGLLRSNVKATADQRVGIYVVYVVAFHSLHETMGGKFGQHRLAFRRIGGPDDESGSSQIVLSFGNPLLWRLTGTQKDEAC